MRAKSVFAAFLLAACAPTAERGATFQCAGGPTVTVAFPAKDVVAVRVGEHPVIRLPRAISASGARYSDGQNEVWEAKGKVSVKLSDGTEFTDCDKQ